MRKINRLVVIGVGLIGGSFALALRKAKAVGHVTGVGRTRRNLAVALRRGVIDAVATDPARAVREADMVFLGTPVGQMGAVMAAIGPHLPAHVVVTDGGSTKRDVIATARRVLGPAFSRFVPAHPIAGTEESGAAAAFPELYRGRNLVLVPQRETAADALRRVTLAWKACGAVIVRMDADTHDRTLGAVSHLPHVVSYALMGMLARQPGARRLLAFSGGGLRDTVRIAGSSPEMWRDICIANRGALLELLDAYAGELDRARDAIDRGDGEALQALFAHARAARARWLVKSRA